MLSSFNRLSSFGSTKAGKARLHTMTQTETSLRETVIAVQGELATMGTRVGTDWEDGMALLRILLEAVAMRNAHLPVTMDAATRRNAYDFARWFRKQD